jgi:hypothetical protein
MLAESVGGSHDTSILLCDNTLAFIFQIESSKNQKWMSTIDKKKYYDEEYCHLHIWFNLKTFLEKVNVRYTIEHFNHMNKKCSIPVNNSFVYILVPWSSSESHVSLFVIMLFFLFAMLIRYNTVICDYVVFSVRHVNKIQQSPKEKEFHFHFWSFRRCLIDWFVSIPAYFNHWIQGLGNLIDHRA